MRSGVSRWPAPGNRSPRSRPPHRRVGEPENAGSRRLLAATADADRHDRALWTAPTRITGGQGNSTALVGTPETVAAALLDYYDLGITLLSARGYDIYDDAIDVGRYVIPLVRQEVAARDAALARTAGVTGQPSVASERESVLAGAAS